MTTFLSLPPHRYERKKNIVLALKAYALLVSTKERGGGGVDKSDVLLVIAGGFDTRVLENVEYHKVSSDEWVHRVADLGDGLRSWLNMHSFIVSRRGT
jgi:hypothetical protein